ncbi:uncharacterized protein LOC110502366 [Oncorhynchus mykiss]|uniref:Cold shock domain-containing protein n=1 Tax=Oncorhynchus mykiss TaxID=8022 RepID=A0A8C7TS73_ONCMY|nr:uncharacterized protein LOC110502366 [Oncorhynchus mykiss]
MGRGGGRKRGKGNGPPPFDMGPRRPHPFDMGPGPGWCGPPGPFGPFHGGPGPHPNFMGDPMMQGPMPPDYHRYGPGYGPMGPGGPMDGYGPRGPMDGYGPMGPGGPMDGCFDGPPMDGPGFGYGPGMPGPYDPMMGNVPGPMPPPVMAPPVMPPPGIPPPGIPPPGMPPMVPPLVDNSGFPPPWQSEVNPYAVPPPSWPVPTTALLPTETTVVPDVWGLCRGSEVPQPDPPQPDEQKTKVSKKDKKSSGKKSYNDKPPPPGRSKGVISFIGPTYGYIERDDLKKYSFTFDAFLGVPKNMIPGVRVHFTAYKEKAGECATDVSVPPGGTEEIDSTIIEGFVCNAIPEQQPGAKQKPGQIEANIDGKTRALLYSEKDSTITLLQGDHVTFNLLTDIVSQNVRATSIRPKTPQTFKITGEKREVGVIMSVKGGSGTIMAANQNNLPFETTENMSLTEFAVMDEVDFTVVTIKGKEKAIRVRKLKCLVTLEDTMEKKVEDTAGKDKWKPVAPVEMVLPQRTVVFEDVSTVQHAGTVIKAVPKVSDKKQEQGLLEVWVGGTQKPLSFEAADVLTDATMFDGDKVHFNISTNRETKEERAVNVEILSETFEESTEQRRTGVVVQAGELSGTIKCHQSPQLLFFHLTEVMEETKLDISEKVEFSVIPLETAEGGNQAIRIKRFIDSVFTRVPKLVGVATKEKKKMTIKLMRDSKLLIKGAGVKVEHKDDDLTNDKPALESDKMKAVVKTLRSKTAGSGSGGKDSDSSRRRYGRRSRSRSPSLDQFGRVKKRRSTSRERKEQDGSNRYRSSRSRSRSRERSSRGSRRRSHSLERKDSKHRSSSKERTSSKRSHSKERDGSSQRSSKNGSSSGSKPPDRMNDELERKKRELDELNELIYRKRAMVAMEQHGGVPNFLPEGKPMEKTCFDYNHGMPELPPQPKPPTDIKPKSILKKRPDHVTGPLFPIQTEPPKAQPLDQRLVEQYGYDVETPYKPHSAQPPFTQTSSQKSYYEGSPAGHPAPDLSAKYDPYEQTSREHPSQPSPVRQTPLDPHSSKRPLPSRESQEKNPNLNTQLARFLNILNKGVDAGLLSTVVKESREEIAGIQEDSSLPQKCYRGSRERGDEDQYKDAYRGREEEPERPHRAFDMERVKTSEAKDDPRDEDRLLPHERAIQDSGGFSGILGMTSHTQFLREPERVEEEDDFLYGGKAPAAAAEEERYEKPGRTDRSRDDGRSSPARAPVEETKKQESQDKTQHFDKIKSLLQAIGLNLNTSEVTKLADRTQERLYGTKSSKHSSDSSERETKHSSRRGDRHRRRNTDSSDSERLRSASPSRSSQQEVYLSPQDTPEYGGFLDPEEEAALEKARQMQSLTKKVSVSPPTTSPTSSSHPGTSYSTTKWNFPDKRQPIAPKGWPSKGCSTNYLSSLLPGPLSPPQNISPVPSLTNTPYVPAGQQTAGVYTYASPVGQSPGLPTALPTAYYGHPGAPMIPFAKTQLTQQVNILNQVTVSNPTMDVLSQILQVNSQSRCLKVIETVKSGSGAQQDSPRHNITIPLQINTQSPDAAAGQPSPPPLSPETPGPPVTEDDIKAKQKKRLEQFNLRMRQKNQQRMNDTRDSRKKNATGKVPKVTFANTEPRNVWICGHSLIYWAEMRAKSPEIGMQLGMDPSSVRVWWKGTQGMTWAQLLPQLDQLKIKWPSPDVVILHLGGNDLGTHNPEALLASVKKDLTSMRSIFPQCLLVWSDILPRISWRHTEDSDAVDNVRAAINRRVHTIIAELGGTALTHDNIMCGSDAGLYRPDGVHLSGKGIDTFNLNLQDFLEKWETEASNGPEMS